MDKTTSISLVKWLVLIASYVFLAYVLLTFDSYGECYEEWGRSVESGGLFFLALMLLLLPVNWLLEAWKWKLLCSDIQRLSLRESLCGVVVGNVTAFFTPNRLGEVAGRSVMLRDGNRARAATLTVVHGLSQTLAISLLGLPMCCLYIDRYSGNGCLSSLSMPLVVMLSLSVMFVSVLLPYVSGWLVRTYSDKHWTLFLRPTAGISGARLLCVVGVSLLRFLTFGLQYFLLLHFFGLDISVLDGAIFIATNYLIITFVPSMSFSEGAVRASVAAMVFAPLTRNVPAIVATGVASWLFNYVIAMLLGSLVLMKKDWKNEINTGL